MTPAFGGMKVGIVTQARMTSTRLPGKVMADVAGYPLLHYHVERLRWSGLPVVVATTVNAADQPIVDFCDAHSLSCHRGSELNVLERYCEAARRLGLTVVIRVTSDCPLIDGHLIRSGLSEYAARYNEHLYASTGVVRTYPNGFNFEIFSAAALYDALEHATLPGELEHVTPYLRNNRSGSVQFLPITRGEDRSHYRIVVDTPEDLALIRRLIVEFQAHRLGAEEIITIMDRHPGLALINSHVRQKQWDE